MRAAYFLVVLFHLLSAAADTGYVDAELEALWSAIPDINHPALDDYRLIEEYISNGERPYLTELYFRPSRIKSIRSFKLIGPDGQMPIFETYSFNMEERSEDRCILLYASPNDIYPQKARQALAEIKECGYSGHVLLRIGGFPNTEQGGLKLSHVPYGFKAAFLREAQLLGYKKILWIDTAIHPLTNLEKIFQEIEERGHFLTWIAQLTACERLHFLGAAQALGVSRDLYDQIPHICSAVIGLNMEHPAAVRCLENWYRATQRVYPNINGYPEELSLSITAWRAKCAPRGWLGDFICAENELPAIIHERPELQFYLDTRR